ncbi:MAG: deoxyribodipyrimidine photo-lyase, partial [Marinobacter sp. T13-3]
MTQLVWFRNDLRIADNPALTAACATGEPVRATFLITPGQWQEHDWSAARVQFVLEHANALARELAQLGIPLHFETGQRFDDSLGLLENLCSQHGIQQVHFNEEYGVNERRRDKQAHARLAEQGIECHKYRDQTVAPVGH